MNVERARAFLLTLPHVTETMQWGDNLVFWLGDKALGGKMFVLINLSRDDKPVVSYAAGAERFAILVEQEDIVPAPYFARIFWVAARSWSAHREAIWQQEFRAAHSLTLAKLPPKTRALLVLPAAQRKRLIAERSRLRSANAASAT